MINHFFVWKLLKRTRGGSLFTRNIQKLLIVALLGVGVVAPVKNASAGSQFFEAIGISTAVGTVLGASTLPFYTQPGDHISNVYIGAAAGFVVGLGIWAIGLFDSEEQAVQNIRNPEVKVSRAPLDYSTPFSSHLTAVKKEPKFSLPLLAYSF